MKDRLIEFGKNKNGRIYDKNSYDWGKLEDISNRGMLMGELSHDGEVGTDVLLSNVSHVIKDIEVYDDGIWAEIKILDTESGNILQELKDMDINFDISSRGKGEIVNGKIVMESITAFDFIPRPETSLQKRSKKLNRILERLKNGNVK